MEVVNENGQAMPESKMLEKYSNLLDSSIKVPGTKFSFGLDPILGFIPVVGDLASYGFSVTLLYYMVKHGCSARLVFKVVGNIALDAVVGMIPVVGTIFDFAYKANDRNMKLFQEYHLHGGHRESVLPLFIGLSLGLLLFIVGLGVLSYKLALWLLSSLPNLGL